MTEKKKFPKLDVKELPKPAVNSSDSKIKNNTPSSILPTDSKNNTIFVPINLDNIRKIAYDISQQSLSINDLNWFISENEIKYLKAFDSEQPLLETSHPVTLKINLNQIVQSPSFEEIKKNAEIIAQKNMRIPERHWNLAVLQYVAHSIHPK